MPRRRHFAAEKLSKPGLLIVHCGRRENWTLGKIQAELLAQTKERVARSSLARYMAKCELELRSFEESQQQADAIAASMRAGDITAIGIGKALLAQSISETKEALKKADPIAMTYALTGLERADIQQRALDIRVREIEFKEKRLEQVEAKQKEMEERTRQAKERVALNPEEGAKLIDELYGLTQA